MGQDGSTLRTKNFGLHLYWPWSGFAHKRLPSLDTPYGLSEVHEFERLGKRILFHVDSLLFFEVSPLVHDLIRLYQRGAANPAREILKYYPRREVNHSLGELIESGILHSIPAPVSAPVHLRKRAGIRHLELMVTHACNMRCRYCYGNDEHEDWQEAHHLYGADESGMRWEVAQQGIDFLLDASGTAKEVSVIFFGGEPLLEFELIQKVVRYARNRAKEHGKRVNFSLSSNGLGLTDEVVEFLVVHRIGCQISIDGPALIHDENRRLASGKGSYKQVMQGVKRLLAKRPGRVPARVTVAKDQANLPEVADHLLNLGFGSVHVEPVIGACGELAIDNDDLVQMQRQTEILARYLLRRVRKGHIFNFSNLVRHVRQTRLVDQRLAHYCGAARTYLALAQDGAFYPCHRFVGMPEYRMGDLVSGFDNHLQKRILGLTVDQRPGCRDCWARYLCGGGCWKHAEDINGGLEQPDQSTSCALIRHQIECAMAINTELKVSDRELLSEAYEKDTEPYRVPEGDS